MPVRALTIDFWNTMVVAHVNGERRRTERFAHLVRTVRRHRPDLAEPAIQAALQRAIDRFDASWRHRHITPTTPEIVAGIWRELDLQVPEDDHVGTVRVFEEGLLAAPPALVDGLAETLAWAAGRYRLAIISDTMFSPGRVIRQWLDRHGLLPYFDAFVFSDETGFSKPDARAFEQAAAALSLSPTDLVHIGDLRRTDVRGARGVGARAVLFTGVHQDDDGPEPDTVLPRWQDLPALLRPA
ncbi:hypothetical protein AWN76_017890 [Rhodothermaceae bacterium RA]|nr:hypothetical protein AWN76_017890 [Rhodothermaceae bacterium RA]